MTRPTYAQLGDACATAHAMELIGSRWTYPILRELFLGPKRFTGLLASVRGITPAVLTSRLHEMTTAGLVQPVPATASTAVPAYTLTAWAHELAPILRELGRWAQSSPIRSDAGGLTPDAVVQAMITMANDIPAERTLQLQLQLVDARVDATRRHAYRVQWTQAGFSAERGKLTDPAATVHCDSSAWGRVLFTGLPIDDSGATITGQRKAAGILIEGFRHACARQRTTQIQPA